MYYYNQLLSGVIAGLISSFLFYFFTYKREKVRKIIEYAKKTADHTYLIAEEARDCSNGEPVENLKQLLRKTIHRPFAGDIVDQTKESKHLQDAIAQCNRSIYEIDKIVEKADQDEDFRNKLHIESNKMSDTLLNIWNAIANYDTAKDKKIMRTFRIFKVILGLIVISLIVNLIYYYFC